MEPCMSRTTLRRERSSSWPSLAGERRCPEKQTGNVAGQRRRGGRRGARLDERQAIHLLEQALSPAGGDRTAGRAKRRIQVGIGDDAAVLRSGEQPLVWTVDVCVEGVHFERRWLSLEDVGWRSFHAALSDLAAMGATPLAALSSLIVPRGISAAQLSSLGRGQGQASLTTRCPAVGGNISRGGQLSVTTTARGEAQRPRLRRPARPGHALWLVGDVGLAAAGHRLLHARQRRMLKGRAWAAERVCIEAWRRPRARGWLDRRTCVSVARRSGRFGPHRSSSDRSAPPTTPGWRRSRCNELDLSYA